MFADNIKCTCVLLLQLVKSLGASPGFEMYSSHDFKDCVSPQLNQNRRCETPVQFDVRRHQCTSLRGNQSTLSTGHCENLHEVLNCFSYIRRCCFSPAS